MKTNPSPSAPLVPLAPPAGITGTTLPASPVKDTPGFPVLEKHYFKSAPASPVESVGVPELQVFPPVNEHDTARIHFAKGDRALVCKIGRNRRSAAESLALAESIVSACASHAAKDAKIKALESALKAFTGHQIFCSDGDDTAPKYRCRCHACISVRSAERALALPCAPLGSFEGSPEGV